MIGNALERNEKSFGIKVVNDSPGYGLFIQKSGEPYKKWPKEEQGDWANNHIHLFPKENGKIGFHYKVGGHVVFPPYPEIIEFPFYLSASCYPEIMSTFLYENRFISCEDYDSKDEENKLVVKATLLSNNARVQHGRKVQQAQDAERQAYNVKQNEKRNQVARIHEENMGNYENKYYERLKIIDDGEGTIKCPVCKTEKLIINGSVTRCGGVGPKQCFKVVFDKKNNPTVQVNHLGLTLKRIKHKTSKKQKKHARTKNRKSKKNKAKATPRKSKKNKRCNK